MTVPAPGGPSSGGAPSGVPHPGGPAVAPAGAGPGTEVPPPPAGPGVAPPFPAPPVEGRTFRMWLGLGVAALAVVLCCGGGAFAMVGLLVAGTEAVNEQARVVVGDYFEALRDRQYGRAYQLLCDDARRRESPAEFEERVAAEPDITAYQVGDIAGLDEITVPVRVTYVGGRQDNLRASLAQDSDTGEFKVCGVS